MDSFDFLRNVESLFAGLLAFIKAFFVTLHGLAFRPRKFAAAFGAAGGPYSGPFSFLTLSTFSIVTVLRNLVTVFMVFVVTFNRGCSTVETMLPSKDVSFMELLKLPSVETIVYVALPVVLLVVAIAHFFAWAIARRRQDSAAQVSSIFPYAVGFQFILIPLLFGSYLVAFTYGTKEEIANVLLSNSSYTCLKLSVLAGVAWPCTSLFRALGALQPPLSFRVERPVLRKLYVGLMCVACLSATFVASSGVAILFARQDVRRLVPTGPLLTASYAELIATPPSSSTDAGSRMPRVSILIRNNADFDIWLLGNGVILSIHRDRPSIKAHVVSGRLQPGVIHLHPGEAMTIDFAIEGYTPEDQSQYGSRDKAIEKPKWVVGFFIQSDSPGNEEEMLVHFSSLGTDGTMGEVNAVLLADKDRQAALETKLAEILTTHQ
jgi:hypothetical protein